jgi:hypothetical protein
VNVIETVQRLTPLGLVFHDLLTDAAITDGLVVSSRPSQRPGRYRPADRTPSGVHVVSGIPGLRDLEFPRPAPGERAEVDDLPSGFDVDVDVLVEDRLDRFLPTVLRIAAPSRGLATAADALAGCSALVWSVPDDLPLFLMSSPQRSIPPTTAVVRACLRHHVTMAPAAHAVLVVDAEGSRSVGVADANGNVVVAFAYPSFAAATPPDSTPPGSHGIPTTDQNWTITVGVRWEPGVLSFPDGTDLPRIHSVLCQRDGTVFADDAGAGGPTIPAVLRYGLPLVLGTGGVTDPARTSFLFVEPAP